MIANAVWNFGPILEHCVADVAGGHIKAADYSEFSFMKYGGNALVYDEKTVPADIAAPALAKQKEIQDGKFTVPIDDSEPK